MHPRIAFTAVEISSAPRESAKTLELPVVLVLSTLYPTAKKTGVVVLSDESPSDNALSEGQSSSVPPSPTGRPEIEMSENDGSAVRDGSNDKVGDEEGTVDGPSDGILDCPSSVGKSVIEGSNESVGERVGPEGVGAVGSNGMDGGWTVGVDGEAGIGTPTGADGAVGVVGTDGGKLIEYDIDSSSISRTAIASSILSMLVFNKW